MVIEQALEKLREAQAAEAKSSSQQRGLTQEALRQRTRAKERAARQRTSAPAPLPAAPLVPRPAFPLVQVHPSAAEINHILLPDMQGGKEAPAGAAYRMLRTRLLQKLRNNMWTSLAITSPGAGEGKSVTVLNLALNIARDKSNDVFVLDLDLRNPSICRYLGVTPPQELVTYFGGSGNPADALFSIGRDNLAFAGSTEPTEHASELIASGRLEELIAYISSISANPIVLIDLPPLLVTDEALMVAPRVDATALVVAEGRTRRDSLARARQLLLEYTFAGVILNRSTESFGADSYYGYGPRYGE